MVEETTPKAESTARERPPWWYSPGLATAILWAAVMIASAIVLMGTDYWGQLLPIFAGAFIAHLVIVEGSRRR